MVVMDGMADIMEEIVVIMGMEMIHLLVGVLFLLIFPQDVRQLLDNLLGLVV